MGKVLDYLASETKGTCYKSHRYCFDRVDIPSVVYDDKQNIIFSRSKVGETDKGFTASKSLGELAKKINRQSKPLFKFFLDGSRRTYKVDDVAYNNRIYPIVAGQIGVGCCIRENPDSFKSFAFENYSALSLPECANKDNQPNELFFNSLTTKINDLPGLKKRNISLEKILPYEDRRLKDDEKYEQKGIAKIQDEMIESEKRLVARLARERKLNFDSYLIKDGSLQYQSSKGGDLKDLAAIKSNYRCVVGVSKSFNPELCLDQFNRSIAKKIADLKLFHRTPAFKYMTERSRGVEFSVWYLRIRGINRTVSPFDGVLKIEKILVTENEMEKGLDSDEIDLISANLINECFPTCYGSDNRWANHLYPVYLTETFIKSKYLSDVYFLNLF